MLFIGMYLSSEFRFGSRIAFRLGASGEKRLQVLDKRTGKPFRVEVQNAKGEILTANDLELVTVKN
jgi:hypothetical protein